MVCNFIDSIERLNQATISARSNRVSFSALTHCEMNEYSALTYSIKYVARGTEHYILNRKKISVSAGHFLLVNKNCPVDVMIQAKKQVHGFCIHLEPDLLKEAYKLLARDEEKLLGDPFEDIFFPEFEELLYSDQENALGKYLQHIKANFDPSGTTISMNDTEIYYELARHLVGLQNSISTEVRNLTVLRNSTKTELLRRLERAKEIMDNRDVRELTIDAIASEAMLSPSHLFHTFRKVYGISPYQYFIKKKIERAAYLLKTTEMQVTEIAFESGFPDLSSFSKAFKKIYGQSPGRFGKGVC